MSRPAIVLYDDDCGFCRWAAAKVVSVAKPHGLRAVPLQDPEADILLAYMEPERRMGSWHLVTPEGGVHSAGAAVPPLVGVLPAGRRLASLASLFPAANEWVYRWIASRRHRLAGWVRVEPCSVEPAKGPADVARAGVLNTIDRSGGASLLDPAGEFETSRDIGDRGDMRHMREAEMGMKREEAA